MADVLSLGDPHEDVHSVAPSDSDVEVASLCGSELEAEMAWGEGPIAPLKMEPVTAEPVRAKSNGNGSSRAKTPQKRADPSPLQKSKRLINIHPMRSPGYLAKPNELPIGGRKQQRWFNDHHFGNKAASTRLEDLMEHMTIDVEWRSNFQKLAEPGNKDLQIAFRKGRVHLNESSNQPRFLRKDDWNEAEKMFARIDRRARTLLLRSFASFGQFIEAVEYAVLYFIQWREVPSDLEVSAALQRMLVEPMEIGSFSESDVRLCIPLADSAFHRLIVHSVCQFYGVRSRTEANRRFNTKIMVLKSPKSKFTQEQLEKISFCDFVRETRLGRNAVAPLVSKEEDPLEDQTKSSECSDGYTLMDFPSVRIPMHGEAAFGYVASILRRGVLCSMHPATLLRRDDGEIGDLFVTSPAQLHEVFHPKPRALHLSSGGSGVILQLEPQHQAPNTILQPEAHTAGSPRRTARDVSARQHTEMVDAEEQSPVVPSAEPPQQKPVEAAPVDAAAATPALATPSVSMEDSGVLGAADSSPEEETSVVTDVDAVEEAEPVADPPAEDAAPVAATDEAPIANGVATAENEPAVAAVENGVEDDASEKAEEQAEAKEIVEDEHQEHATIAEVTESVNPADTKEEKIEDVIAKIKSMMACEVVEVLESGEILVLPKGWSTRASKTHGGKTYYVSPYGQTQWLRPPMKTNIGYKWVHEIEVTFGDGRLGLNLKQISSEPGQPFSDLLVHIAEIYKLGNGMASPAEIYNWSVKPEKRLHVGMRMTAINGIPLTGCTYSDILDRINRLPRPLRIKFADITRGIVGRVKEEPVQEETEEEKEARLNRTRQTDLRMEYLQVLVAHELRLQVWKVSRGRMLKKEQELKKKDEILTAQINAMMEYQSLLEKETESLVHETANLNQMIEQLKQQEAGAVPSPEVAKTPALQERNVALDKEVTDGMKENEELRQERVQLEEALDAVQKELDLYGGDFDDGNGRDEIDVFSSAFLGTIVERGSLDRDAENAREVLLMKIIERRRQLDLDMCEEAEQIRALETDLVQLRRQMANVDSSARREEDLISGDKPPQLISLEVKVETLQKNLHETVTAMAAAAKEGNRTKLDNLSIRRTGLNEELRKARDDVSQFEAEYNVRSSLMDRRLSIGSSLTPQSSGRFSLMLGEDLPVQGSSDSSNLQGRLAAVRSDLHDTVMQLTRATSAKDTKLMKELSGRRLQLKEEEKSIQDEYQMLTRESIASLPPLPPRPSSDRSSMDRILIGDGPRERSNSRSSSISTTSHASLAMSVDSNTNYPATPSAPAASSSKPTERVSVDSSSRPNAMPVFGGQLMKHPSHSNEKGMFGNMSLRGVRERYCKLDGSGALLYYKRKSDREPRGSIPLNDPALEVVYAQNEAKSTEFSICTPTHQNKFVAKTRAEMMKWIHAIETTHALLMERRSVTSQGARSSSTKENTLRRQESVASNEDNGRASTGGLAPAALALAMAADGRPSRGSMSVRDSSSSATQQHRATLGF